ncbi:MAG: hypothetical protein L0G99_12545, partial [Propionibacteriales bacterium]|nr:hypothetical protein [Propionibacteriales bacterium]
SPIGGLVIATGHHRNGVLLTPITAQLITELIVTGVLPEAARPFNPWGVRLIGKGGSRSATEAHGMEVGACGS